ncbi:MAG: tRNA lysidine(34) synthetase TilS [Ruminococcus sp.]|nr:tRNA lysidine(34) synthetase TilS [Ruminococcus sp.]
MLCHKPYDTVYQFLLQEQIQNMPVTVAFSGGADSVCLLLCLLHWQKKFNLHISALHVQHHLRGAESLRDENFCKDFCQKYQVALQVVSVDVLAYQKQKKCSLETAARDCRYQVFEKYKQGLVATAHTASDNLETLIFRLARGTGLKGLCGIPPRREIYIRPLLQVSRKEIELFLQEKNINFITDSSNLQDDYSRNFIRHHIVPLFNRLTKNAEKSACMIADILRQEEDFLEISAKSVYLQVKQSDNCLKNLQALHPALQRRCIAFYLQENQIAASYQNIILIQKLLSHGGQAEIVRNQVLARVSQNLLFLQKINHNILEKNLQIGENQIFSGYLVHAELVSRKNSEKFERIYKKFANSALDYDIIEKNAVLHGRKSGLYLKLSDREHRISIKKWLQTLPVSKRTVMHYLSDNYHNLLWVQDLGVAEHAIVTEHTSTMLVLHVHESDTECT